jgi:hypothetical protein
MKPVPPITTRVGHYSTDELRFHGRRVFAELLGKSSFGQVLLLGLCGRQLDGDELGTVDDIITAMSSADPRLWPFKITRLASSYGTAAYGVGATLVGSQGGIFGPNRMASAGQWLVDLHERDRGEGISDDEILSVLQASGGAFGVLYRTRDERLEALIRQVTKRGRHERTYARLAIRALRVARERAGLEAHVYLGIAALCLDLGLSIHEVGAFGIVVLFHDTLANATEGSLQCPDVLQTLPADHVRYAGKAARTSPRGASQTEP